jgi:ribose transport system ATP-binding protein
LYTSFLRFGFISRRRLGRLYAEQASVLSLKAGSPQDLVTTLSGGNQQKVIIGRALAQAPKVVALNDPARGVDIRTKRELYAQLERLAAQGTGIVYLSSEIDELVDLCDRVAVFRDAAIFEWLDADAITSELILASMFGHAEVDFDSANALVTP